MVKKQNPVVLEINPEIAERLGILKKSDVEMILMDDMLVIKSKKKKASIVKKVQAKKNLITEKLMTEYGAVLKKLAKT